MRTPLAVCASLLAVGLALAVHGQSGQPAAGPKPSLQITGLSAPESVLYDPEADLYLVSNINGSPFDKDDNGFIAQVAPNGQMRAPRWIDGARNDLILNAPKGMAFLGDTLYVADIDTVRTFNRKTGAPKDSILVNGASFLNDIAVSGQRVYVSDTGVKQGFKPSGTAAIYQLQDGKVTAVARGEDLQEPNGLATRGEELWTVTFAANQVYRIGKDGHKADAFTVPQGQLDGLLILPDGTFLVSSWKGSTVFAGRPGSTFTAVIGDVPSPADIGFDSKRSRVLVPLLMKDRVDIFDWSAVRGHLGRTAARRSAA
jgi:hypothetical protein